MCHSWSSLKLVVKISYNVKFITCMVSFEFSASFGIQSGPKSRHRGNAIQNNLIQASEIPMKIINLNKIKINAFMKNSWAEKLKQSRLLVLLMKIQPLSSWPNHLPVMGQALKGLGWNLGCPNGHLGL